VDVVDCFLHDGVLAVKIWHAQYHLDVAVDASEHEVSPSHLEQPIISILSCQGGVDVRQAAGRKNNYYNNVATAGDQVFLITGIPK
jgi:hypothetical protein